jgi:hypothetical protein
MEFNIHKISAFVIILGSIFFLIAAFSPISRVFAEPSANKKLEIIMESRNAWTFSQFFFAAGALITVIGIGLSGVLFRAHPFSSTIYVSAAFLLVGAIFWIWHVYLRAIDPAAFTEGTIPVWLFAAYTFLTQAGLIIYGAAFLQTGIPEWVGWMMIVSMSLFFLLTIIFKDMPPLVYYLITLVTGIMIYRSYSLAGSEAY